MRRRGIRFQPTYLETGRKYMWRREFLPLLYRYLELSKNMTVLDVGCGTGFFSRLVSRGMRKTGRVIGIDRNRSLVSASRKIARIEGFSPKALSFRVGQAEKLPFPKEFADRVVCQTLLWIVKDPRRVLEEMTRVCKVGGMVVALDWAYDSIIHYFPAKSDLELNSLENSGSQAENLGYRRMYGNDRTVASKLPTIFKQIGLERVRLESYAYSSLGSDDRVSRDHKIWSLNMTLDECEKVLQSLPNERKSKDSKVREQVEILRLGGMSTKSVRRLYEMRLYHCKRLLADHTLIENDTAVNAGIMIITTGLKPNLRQEVTSGSSLR